MVDTESIEFYFGIQYNKNKIIRKGGTTMKKTVTAIIATVILTTMLCFVLTGCRKESQNKMSEEKITTQTVPVDETKAMPQQLTAETTIPETTETVQDIWGVKVLESTPNEITSEITNQKGETIKTTTGVEKSAETVPEEPDDAGNKPTQTQPKPTQPEPTQPKPTDPKPTGSVSAETKPIQSSGDVIKVEKPGTDITFSDYESMSGEEQMLFYYSFADANAFNAWYENAKAVHDAGREEIIIGEDGMVNLG